MNQGFLVSIITVVFNGEKYLQQTIDSVFNQTYKNIEYIIIDGGSTDNTVSIIKENKDKISKWISEPDNGLYDAMNKGIKMSTGELIGTINSDDWYEPDAVQLSVNAYLENPKTSIVHSDRYDVLPTGEKSVFKFNPSDFKFKYFSMTYSHPSMFISKKIYREHQYNTNMKSFSDYQLILEVFLRHPKNFTYIPKPLVNFRLGGVSGSLSFFEVLKEGYQARKLAGMNTIENLFSLCLKLALQPVVWLKRIVVKNLKI
ncbi:glycosyltransferase [Subsaxibacter sp. CAU 1640]|uniref:glycosyltransferase family 2 protein n=1 Tax=Subsaxibacter sp. CAU 1640 TaxID=2933271 RepID=UPI002005EDEB|nr:glycosyltransferase family 2 protein [Subsaxibacter sp. CAU 1640]MCK7589529.1 glycosyltransferase [Subsaxibacter sp. CAU 1640]